MPNYRLDYLTRIQRIRKYIKTVVENLPIIEITGITGSLDDNSLIFYNDRLTINKFSGFFGNTNWTPKNFPSEIIS